MHFLRLVSKGRLKSSALSADGLTAGRPIVYSRSDRPRELKEYHYHFWTEPPPVMLRDQLVAYLRGANVASAVVTPELRVAVNYALTGKIKRLERVIGVSPGSAKAVVELELGVRQTAGERLLFLDTYRVETEAAGDTVGAAVDAINEGLKRVFALFVARHFQKFDCAVSTDVASGRQVKNGPTCDCGKVGG